MPETSIFTEIINSYLAEPQASLLNGIIFGEDLKTTSVFKNQLKTVGLIHIVVLSGANITLLTSIISNFTSFLGKKLSLILSSICIVLFVMFVGTEPPIVRAACMGILSSIAIVFGKRYIILYAMFISVIFIALFWTEWLTTISFQLSYAATLGLIIFGKKRKNEVQNNNIHKKNNEKNHFFQSLYSYFEEELRISLAAQAFTVPIIFIYFKQISLISPMANVAIAWTIAPLMIFGTLTAVLGRINYVLGLLPSYICHFLLTYIVLVVEFLAKIPYAAIDLN